MVMSTLDSLRTPNNEAIAEQQSSFLNSIDSRKITRALCILGLVYGSTNAAIDFGMGLEARRVVAEQQDTTYIHDENAAFHDARRQAVGALISTAAIVLLRKRQD
ncbi:MAG: hypothetical protein NVSMB46_03440 [Candidatus Saccharimonadales bacterium]